MNQSESESELTISLIFFHLNIKISATLGNALIYIFPGFMFRGAIKKCVANPTRQQKVEVKIAMSSAVLGTVLGIIGAIQAVRSIL